jgi:methionyl-tRNA synthetase
MTFRPAEKAPFSITTPLYYVNDLPHIGSAYTTIAADVIARFHRLKGLPVLMITGTDEHGQKIQRTAEVRQKSPQDHCDEIVVGFQSLWQQLNIAYDRFSRTTAPRHEAIVREFFQRVWDKGDIYEGHQQGWYCVSCEEFKEERDLLPGNYCALFIPTSRWNGGMSKTTFSGSPSTSLNWKPSTPSGQTLFSLPPGAMRC